MGIKFYSYETIKTRSLLALRSEARQVNDELHKRKEAFCIAEWGTLDKSVLIDKILCAYDILNKPPAVEPFVDVVTVDSVNSVCNEHEKETEQGDGNKVTDNGDDFILDVSEELTDADIVFDTFDEPNLVSEDKEGVISAEEDTPKEVVTPPVFESSTDEDRVVQTKSYIVKQCIRLGLSTADTYERVLVDYPDAKKASVAALKSSLSKKIRG
jgi:hypothetical protein